MSGLAVWQRGEYGPLLQIISTVFQLTQTKIKGRAKSATTVYHTHSYSATSTALAALTFPEPQILHLQLPARPAVHSLFSNQGS
jgi:hypothetical protein